MERLRSRLQSASASLHSIGQSLPQIASSANDRCRLLAAIAPGIIAFLVDDARIFIINSTASAGPKPHLLHLDQALPSGSKELVASPTDQGTFAVIAERGVAVVECANSYTSASVIHVGSSLFQRRPQLKVLHVAWSPHADAFLALLTSDEKFRLFDVASRKSAEVERFRLRVVTAGAGPTSFAFGRASGWDSISVYILAEDGAMYVASPIVPIGTRISAKTWTTLRDAAVSAIERDQNGETESLNGSIGDPFLQQSNRDLNSKAGLASSVESSPQRQFDHSLSSNFAAQRESTTRVLSWTNRQSEMQLRFLTSVFEPTNAGDEMIAVREFKPAELLFQGPLFVEQDDANEFVEEFHNKAAIGDNASAHKFDKLTLIQHGFEKPPVFMRTSSLGETSVLILMEAVEAQWFLGTDSFGIQMDGGIVGSEEYVQLAKTVAPSLLCFEHLSFPGQEPVELFPLSGKADCTVLFAVVGAFVYSVRLPFLSVIDNPSALEVCPVSTISPLLDTRSIASERPSRSRIIGLAQSFERGFGPLAVVVDSKFSISITPSLRWTMGMDHILPAPVIESKPSAEMSWNNQRPTTGNRAFACAETGREVLEAVQELRAVEGRQGWNVADGTLTSLNNAKATAPILSYLETRVAAYTGTATHPGVGDTVKSLVGLIGSWSGELEKMSRANLRCLQVVSDEFNASSISANSLRRKVNRAAELNENLRDRIAVVRTLLATGTGLSEAERDRYVRLKERKRRVVALHNRFAELRAAVKAMDKHEDPKGTLETMAPARYGVIRQKRWSTNGTFGRSPLEKRRDDWIIADQRIDLGHVELRQIKETLETHSKEIAESTDTCAGLWVQLNGM